MNERRHQLLPMLIIVLHSMLMLRPAVGDSIPKSGHHHDKTARLERRVDESTAATQLKTNYREYSKLCEAGSDLSHPCFTHWGTETLSNVKVTFDNSKLDPVEEILVKDDKRKDFTIKDPTQGFTISYLGADTTSVQYGNFSSGCYDIRLAASKLSDWRVWVSKEGSRDHDLDTKKHPFTNGRICSKWLHIDVSENGWFSF